MIIHLDNIKHTLSTHSCWAQCLSLSVVWRLNVHDMLYCKQMWQTCSESWPDWKPNILSCVSYRKSHQPDMQSLLRLQRRRQPAHLLDERGQVHRGPGRRASPGDRPQVSLLWSTYKISPLSRPRSEPKEGIYLQTTSAYQVDSDWAIFVGHCRKPR